MNKLGFSVIFSSQRTVKFYEDLLFNMLGDGCESIEVNVLDYDILEKKGGLIDAINLFSYKLLHSSDIFSSLKSHLELNYFYNLIERLNADAITVHPHTMKSWAWVNEFFGDKTSFENMDWRVSFGKDAKDMSKVFNDFPKARWTFDLNHAFTIDSTMQVVREFNVLKEHLGHYHLSVFKDSFLPHTILWQTKQRDIIAAISTEHPIIIESFGVDDIEFYKKEYDYVLQELKAQDGRY